MFEKRKNVIRRRVLTLSACVLMGACVWVAPSVQAKEGVAHNAAHNAAHNVAQLTAAAYAVPDRYSAQTAQTILQAGGNAVDAAVAVAFTLAVTYPEAGNIGGGGFMTLYVNGSPYFLDYRERAPMAASADMYLDKKGDVIPGMSLYGPRAAGVPGTVDGMWQAHRRFGKLPWSQVLQPAIRLAEAGFEVPALLAARRDKAKINFSGKTNFLDYFGGFRQADVLTQPELAATLTRIAKHGTSDFYRGETARMIADAMYSSNGLITLADLEAYKATWRTPVTAQWNGYRVITAPPPSSGGVGLVQLLRMKEILAPQFQGIALNSPQYVHLVSEIEKRVFADRAQYLGDPDFYRVPVAKLIDTGYLRLRAGEVDASEPSATASVKPGLGTTTLHATVSEKPETTHFSIIDRWGNAVSNTYTLNGPFGSGAVVAGAGFVLNDQMDDFAARPGTPNMFGVVGSDANAITPGKRPLSSMTPTILTKQGKVALVVGTPGGSRIFTSVFQVITNLYDFHLPLKKAVSEMRFHHQLLPENTLFSEPYSPITGALAQAITARGYKIVEQNFNGDIQAIQIIGNTPDAASDPRARGVSGIVRSVPIKETTQ